MAGTDSAASGGPPIPGGTPEQIARAVFERVAARDVAGIGTFQHPDLVEEIIPVGTYHGPDGLMSFFRELFDAFPDLETTVEQVTADETGAVVRWRMRGRFIGRPFLGIEANGKVVEIRGVDVRIEPEDGLIRRNVVIYNGADFMSQVGMIPRRGSRAEALLIRAFNLTTRIRGSLGKR